MKEQRESRVSGEREEAPHLSSLSTPTLWLVPNGPRGRPPSITGVKREVLCVPPKGRLHTVTGNALRDPLLYLTPHGSSGNVGAPSVRLEKSSRMVWMLRLKLF